MPLAPGAGRRQVAVGRHQHALRHVVPGHRRHELAVAECLLVEPHRRADRLGEPVDREDARRACRAGRRSRRRRPGVAPAVEFLDDPGRKAGGRVVEPDRERRRLGALQHGIGGLGKGPAVDPLEILLLLGRRVVGARILRIDVDDNGRRAGGQGSCAPGRAPTPPPRSEPENRKRRIAELVHQPGPEMRRLVRFMPRCFGWPEKPKPGSDGMIHVEGAPSASAVSSGNQRQQLDEIARPAIGQQDRHVALPPARWHERSARSRRRSRW